MTNNKVNVFLCLFFIRYLFRRQKRCAVIHIVSIQNDIILLCQTAQAQTNLVTNPTGNGCLWFHDVITSLLIWHIVK